MMKNYNCEYYIGEEIEKNIVIPLEEYKKLLEIKGRYEELKAKAVLIPKENEDEK